MTTRVFGFLLPGGNEIAVEDSDEEEEEEEEDELLDMRDITGVADGAEIVEGAHTRTTSRTLCRLKESSGVKKIDATADVVPVRGFFPLIEPWWQVETLLRPKQNGRFERTAHGFSYYSLRNDTQADHTLLSLFLKQLFDWQRKIKQESLKKSEEEAKSSGRDVSSNMNKECNNSQQRTTLGSHRDFLKLAESRPTWSNLQCVHKLDQLLAAMEDTPQAKELRSMLQGWEAWKLVKLAMDRPAFFRLFSKILPRHIKTVITLDEDVLESLEEAMKEQPWVFGFKEILYNRYSVCGFEASVTSLENSELWAKIPADKREALKLYTALKENCSRFGNTWCRRKYMKAGLLKEKLYHFEAAMAYLVEERVFVQEDQCIMLYGLWKAESGIAKRLAQLHHGLGLDPMPMEVDLDSPEFANISADPDQKKAVEVLCKHNVVVLSGKGGCGKTTVVSTVFRPKESSWAGTDGHASPGMVTPQKADCRYPHGRLGNEEDSMSQATPFSAYQTSTCLPTVPASPAPTRPLPAMQLTPVKGNMPPSPATTPERELTPVQDFPSPSPSSSLGITPLKHKLDMFAIASPKRELPTAVSQGSPAKRRLVMDETSKAAVKGGLMTYSEFMDKLKCVAVKIGDPPKSRILLTAPTGKAANLLGKRSDIPAYTLHQVIYSYLHWICRQKDGNETEWTYSRTRVLIVDECSLVAVTVFETLLCLLQEHANLQKVVLLGDILQLPSVQPGNFLQDVWNAMKPYNCCVMLTHNHRTGSELLVANAGAISEQHLPEFDPKRNFSFVQILGEENEAETGGHHGHGYVNLTQAMQSLLKEDPHLKNHKDSQFVAFRNNDCKAINEACCKFYSDHSMKENTKGRVKSLFQVGDKICMKKNGNLPVRDLILEELQAVQQKWQRKVGYVAPVTIGAQMKDGVRSKKDDVATPEKSFLPMNGQCPTPVASSNSTEHATQNIDDDCDGVGGGDCRVNGKDRFVMQLCQMNLKAGKASPEARLCNGEIFFITDDTTMIDNSKKRRYLTLEDPDTGRNIRADLRDLRRRCKMEHSWARTIHTFQISKAHIHQKKKKMVANPKIRRPMVQHMGQGSEVPTVVYVVGNDCKPQTWQHVYTAMTRGKERVYVISNRNVLKNTIERLPRRRMTTLHDRLTEDLKKGSDEKAARDLLDEITAETQNGLDFEDEDPIWDFSSDEGAGQEVQWTQLKPKLAGTAGNFRRSDSLHWNSDTDEDLVMASQAAEAYL